MILNLMEYHSHRFVLLLQDGLNRKGITISRRKMARLAAVKRWFWKQRRSLRQPRSVDCLWSDRMWERSCVADYLFIWRRDLEVV